MRRATMKTARAGAVRTSARACGETRPAITLAASTSKAREAPHLGRLCARADQGRSLRHPASSCRSGRRRDEELGPASSGLRPWKAVCLPSLQYRPAVRSVSVRSGPLQNPARCGGPQHRAVRRLRSRDRRRRRVGDVALSTGWDLLLPRTDGGVILQAIVFAVILGGAFAAVRHQPELRWLIGVAVLGLASSPCGPSTDLAARKTARRLPSPFGTLPRAYRESRPTTREER